MNMRRHKHVRELIARARAQGWHGSLTSKGHIRLMHDRAARFVIAPGTPSDYRSWKNTLAQMNRLVPA
ncbi:hypothetical protein [Komagataeibacter oboediens]|uniref:hypothetical protein n=1 Tax=Komagataeibacter oboediens TaxID=65958 RepID=UPI001907F56C|nr:hypothetical protein [Komagataeibacter oboediens]GCE80351.1 hypothetical protein MSKU3_1826 [Komagataeibacter oboediens]